MAAGGSNGLFTVTFGNLRQYLMEHQLQQPPRHQLGNLTGADLRLGLGPVTAAAEGPAATDDRTMKLFPTCPGIAPQGPQLSLDLPEAPEKAPLTILYEGQVHVFEDINRDKVMKLMQLAGTWSSASQVAPPESGSPAGTVVLKRAADLQLGELLDMPVRRKASLRRFLCKRQYRTPSNYHYQRMAGENDEAADFRAMNDEPSASWLHL